MRKATQSVVAIMSLGVLAASYKFGIDTAALAAANNIASGSTLSNASSASDTTNTDASANGTTAGSSGKGSSNSGTSAGTGGNSTSSSSSTGTKTPTKHSGSGSTNTSSGSSSSSSGSSSSTSGSSSSSNGSTSSSGASSSSSGSSNSGLGAATAVTKTGQAIPYAFGTVQVSVTKAGSTITAINMIKGSYTRGPADLWTVLINAAVSAQSSNFGNYSRVTYSTDAFKAAMESALAQF